MIRVVLLLKYRLHHPYGARARTCARGMPRCLRVLHGFRGGAWARAGARLRRDMPYERHLCGHARTHLHVVAVHHAGLDGAVRSRWRYAQRERTASPFRHTTAPAPRRPWPGRPPCAPARAAARCCRRRRSSRAAGPPRTRAPRQPSWRCLRRARRAVRPYAADPRAQHRPHYACPSCFTRCKLVCCSLHDPVAEISSKSHAIVLAAWFTVHWGLRGRRMPVVSYVPSACV